jgi:hypothetical protein
VVQWTSGGNQVVLFCKKGKHLISDNMVCGLQIKAEKYSYGNNNIPGGLGPGGIFVWIECSHGIQL